MKLFGRYWKVIDSTENPTLSNASMLFFRKNEKTKEVPWYQWCWMTLVEILFGHELLESLTVTSSARRESSARSATDVGWEASLNRHIPRGLIIDRFRRTLIAVLYFKHFHQYHMLQHVNPPTIIIKEMTIDLSTAQFAVRKGVLYQVIYFRRIYYLMFLLANLLFNSLVYFLSDSIVAAITAFFVIHIGKGMKV